MLRIKPLLKGCALALPDGRQFPADSILWQGIHVCALTEENGRPRHLHTLPSGHSAWYPYSIDLLTQSVSTGDTRANHWLWKTLLDSMKCPAVQDVGFKVEVFKSCRDVVILNCLDNYYGHCLLKLLNADRHLQDHPHLGLIVIIPAFLRWLVPEGVAEVWSVDLGLRAMSSHYPDLHRKMAAQCARFDTIHLSEAFSHPSRFRIENYARVLPHDLQSGGPKVTFIWREDRLWSGGLLARVGRRLGSKRALLRGQNTNVLEFFTAIRSAHPDVECVVSGLGSSTKFPQWIRDERVARFTPEIERRLALGYAESRLVVGVHGSNMLLPSALAGMTLDLMPSDRWDLLPVDLLITEKDPRIAAFRYRFLPVETPVLTLAGIAASMLSKFREVPRWLSEDSIASPLASSRPVGVSPAAAYAS